jgi:hypothetical protein
MNTTLMKFLRNAWVATGMVTAQLRAKEKEICTNIIERALLRRHFALRKLPHLQQFACRQAGSEIVRSRNMDKRLMVHPLPLEVHLNH